MTAAVPHSHRVIVGRVDALSLWIDATELYSVVEQQLLPVAPVRPLLHLGLGKRRHLTEVTVRPASWNDEQGLTTQFRNSKALQI